MGLYANRGGLKQSYTDIILFASITGDVSIPGGFTLTVDIDGALTCISTGGPATTATWTRDSTLVTEGNETRHQRREMTTPNIITDSLKWSWHNFYVMDCYCCLLVLQLADKQCCL